MPFSKTAYVLSPQLREASVCYAFYTPLAGKPLDNGYPFRCLIELPNFLETTVMIHRCKWVLKDSENQVKVMEEDFDLKQFILIKPYENLFQKVTHVVTSRLTLVEGAYHGIDTVGRPVCFKIPSFEMQVPE